MAGMKKSSCLLMGATGNLEYPHNMAADFHGASNPRESKAEPRMVLWTNLRSHSLHLYNI